MLEGGWLTQGIKNPSRCKEDFVWVEMRDATYGVCVMVEVVIKWLS